MRFALLIAALLSVTTACASRTAGVQTGLPDVNAGTNAPLRPGDRLAVKVWSDTAISDTFIVATSGELALPKIGIFDTGAMGARALQDSVRRAYTALVQDPAVQISALRRVGVVGQVRQPGVYFSDLSMTIGDVVALAGGITENGTLSHIEVRRGTETTKLDLREGGGAADGIRSGDQIIVGLRGFWARNPGLLVSTLSGLFYLLVSRIN